MSRDVRDLHLECQNVGGVMVGYTYMNLGLHVIITIHLLDRLLLHQYISPYLYCV